MKNFTFLVFVLISTIGLSQELSLKFNNTPLKDAIISIEEQSNYTFYFVEDWLLNKNVSGSFTNASVAVILDELFNETDLNYYITNDHRIILTKYSIIYNQLPEGFFGNETVKITTKNQVKTIVEDENGNYNPVFISNNNSAKVVKTEIVRIGKQSQVASKSRFILKGTISNFNTNNTLANIVLKVKGRNNGTVTDAKGNYEMALPPGLNEIEITSLGFANVQKNVIIYNDGRFNISLVEEIESLDEVLIKTNVEKNIEEVNTGTTTIDVKIIKNIPLVLGERDIFKVAASLPGISSAGEGASGYNVRGGKTDQNLYLLDDAVIYNPTHFFGIFSAINPFTTGNVTIYKGNIPAEFGGRLSSVFDIKTKDSNVEKLSGEASVGPVTSSLALEIPLVKDKTSILIGGRTTYSDWILKALDDENLQNSSASFYDAIVKFNTKIGKKDELKITGYLSKDKFSITSDSTYSFSNQLLSARWNHTFTNKNSGSLIITNSAYDFDIDFDGVSNTDFKFAYKNTETEIKLMGKYQPNKQHKITYGISSKYYKIKPGEINPNGAESSIIPLVIANQQGLESAVFISDIVTVNEKLILNGGIRYSLFMALGEAEQRIYADGLPLNNGTLINTLPYSKNEVMQTYGGPEFRLSTRYLLGNDYSIKASFNNANQYIHALSNNTTVSPVDTWMLSDTNIKPQKALQYSLGFYKNLTDNMYEFSIEGYFKKSKNVLDYKVGSQFILNETIETDILQGDGKAYGIEFLIRKTKGRLNGWVGYTYSKSLLKLAGDFAEEVVNNGDYFPSNYDKPHDFSAVTNFKITQRYSVSGNFVYQTGRPVTVPVGNYILDGSEYVLYSNRNEYRIPDYNRLDLSFNVEGNHRNNKLTHTFWNFSIYNVLGRNNPYSVFFVNENGEIKAYQSSIFSVPIPTVTFNIKF